MQLRRMATCPHTSERNREAPKEEIQQQATDSEGEKREHRRDVARGGQQRRV